MNRCVVCTIGVLAVVLQAGVARAQASNFVAPASTEALGPPGWTITPAIAVGSGWDDNVLIRTDANGRPSDVLTLIDPSATLTFNGRRSQLGVAYNGSLSYYRELNQLDSVEQDASLFGRRHLSPHLALFVRNQAATVPTTELAALVAVPFIRVGSRLEDLQSGVEADLSKYTSIVVSYNFTWVDFDQNAPGETTLQGGHSHGATASVRHRMSERFTGLADYDAQRASLRLFDESVDIQNARVGGEYALSAATRVFATVGFSTVSTTPLTPGRTDPAWEAGLARQIRRASVDLHYSRAFAPSYGFGTTMQNQEATGRLQLPFGRRFVVTSAVSWRIDDPLTTVELPVHSWWYEGTLTFQASRFLRIEGFYSGTRQSLNVPGNLIDRNVVGFQVVTAAPLRIR